MRDTGDRHSGRPARPPLQILLPGRRLDHAPSRRLRLGAGDLRAPGRPDGRAYLGRKRAGCRQRLSLHHADLPVSGDLREAHLEELRPELTDKRLLIVDDNATNRRILTLQAEAWSMTSAATESPRQALAWLERASASTRRFLDMHMPEMDGLALALAIRETHGPDQLPLLLLSSLGRLSPDQEGKVARAHFAEMLAKPIKPSPLLNALMGVFSGQPTRVLGPRQEQSKLFDHHLAERLPLRILLADDHATNQKLGQMILARLGYRADIAGNGRGGLGRPGAEGLRPDPDGHRDAGDGRPGGDRRDPPALGRQGPAHRRHDRQRHARRPRPLSRSRHGRLRQQADPHRGLGSRPDPGRRAARARSPGAGDGERREEPCSIPKRSPP